MKKLYYLLFTAILIVGTFAPPNAPVTFINVAHAVTPWACGIDLNGFTPRAGTCEYLGEIIPTNASAIDCETGSTGPNPAAPNELIVKADGATTAEIEDQTYWKRFFCDSVDPETTDMDFSMDCSAQPDGRCHFVGFHDDDGRGAFDHTVHPRHRDREDLSIIGYIRCGDTGACKGITISNLAFAGDRTDASPYLQFRGTNGDDSDYVVNQTWFDTYDSLGLGSGRDFMLKCPAFAVNYLGVNDSDHFFWYNYINGDDTAIAECDGDDTGGVRTNIFTSDLKMGSNEIRDTGDNIIWNADPTNNLTTSKGMYAGANHLYKSSRDYVSCDNPPNAPASDLDTCQCGENNMDIKYGGVAGDPMIIEDNISSGGRPQAPSLVRNLSFGCGGTGAKPGSDFVGHLQLQDIQYVRNIHRDSGEMISMDAGCADNGCAEYGDFARNILYDRKQRHLNAGTYPDTSGPPAARGFSVSNFNNSRIMQNTDRPLNAGDDCVRSNNATNDFEGNLWDAPCTFDILNGGFKQNGYANGSDIIGADTDPKVITTLTFNDYCYYENPITGAEIVGGPFDGHRGNLVCIPVIPTGGLTSGLYTDTPDPTKGPR